MSLDVQPYLLHRMAMQPRDGGWRWGLAWLAVTLLACPNTHATEDAAPGETSTDVATDASAACSAERTVTVVVIANTDGGNELRWARGELVAQLVDRLLSGDIDDDGGSDITPVTEVRILTTSNETCDDSGSAQAAWVSDHVCARASTTGDVSLVARADTDWRGSLMARLVCTGVELPLCVAEPLETALVALSGHPPPVELSAEPLGDTGNAAWQDHDDVLVLLLEAADWRDDCSRRFDQTGLVDACAGGAVDPLCCAANLPPVSRTSGALRSILGDRPSVIASLGQHPAFDPRNEPASTLDSILDDGISVACGNIPDATPAQFGHARMVELARDLYPDMHLVPLTCTGRPPRELASTEALARHVFSRFCE
ncbi:MAG: hypothetical protein U0353_02150 [Sandaracinus sp.]